MTTTTTTTTVRQVYLTELQLRLFCDYHNYSSTSQANSTIARLFPDKCEITGLFQVFQVYGNPASRSCALHIMTDTHSSDYNIVTLQYTCSFFVDFKNKSFIKIRFASTRRWLWRKPLTAEMNVNGEWRIGIVIIEMLQERSAAAQLQQHVSTCWINVRCTSNININIPSSTFNGVIYYFQLLFNGTIS